MCGIALVKAWCRYINELFFQYL